MEALGQGVEERGTLDRRGVDRHLVGARQEDIAHVFDRPNAAADSVRNEHLLRDCARQVLDGGATEAGELALPESPREGAPARLLPAGFCARWARGPRLAGTALLALLVLLAGGAAYLYSLAATLLPGLFPASFRNDDGTLPVYFEAAAVIVTTGTPLPSASC